MNRLLLRQLKRAYGKAIDPNALSDETKVLLDAVAKSYDAFDSEKRFLEHTLQVSSEELTEANKTIERQNAALKQEMALQHDLLEQYRYAIDQTLLVSKTDPTGRISYVNDLFCNISGYRRDELIGSPHSIVRHPDVPKETFRVMWDTIQAGKLWRGELKNRKKNGDTYYVMSTIAPIKDHNGEIIEYIALRQDITARVQTEKALEKERHYANMLFEHQNNVVVTANKEDGVLTANQLFFSTFGFSDMRDFKKHHKCICDLFISKEGYLPPSSDEQYWTEPILQHPDRQHKALMRNAAGEERTFAVTVKELIFERESFALATFTDVTELEEARKNAIASEKAKAQFMANMSHEIRTPMNGIVGFTQLLKKSKLTTKQDRFVSLIEQSTKTLIGIVNDILDFSKIESGKLELDLVNVNPFVDLRDMIAVFSSTAAEKGISLQIDIDPSISECLKMDQLRVTQILTNLISNAIKFTPTGGTVSISIRRVAFDKQSDTLYFEVSDTGIGIAPEKLSLIFEAFTQADSSTTRGFGGTGLGLSISQSLCRLMGGEIKARSDSGKGSSFSFQLRFEACAPRHALAREISHPPIYIIKSDSELYPKVFQILNHFGIRFETLDVSSLGQMEANHITILFDHALFQSVNAHAANIILIDDTEQAFDLVRQEEKIYHIFDFNACPSMIYNAILALNVIPQDNSFKQMNIESLALKVLVAEDYEINRILIEELLSEYGITPIIALDGEMAVQKALTAPFDIILMDINMPKLNGMDATSILREKGITTPIIALTANALDGDRERFLSFGMNDYVSKPIDSEELDRILKTYAVRSGSDADAEPDDGVEVGDTASVASLVDTAVQSLLGTKEKYHFGDDAIFKLFNKFVDTGSQSLEVLLEAVERQDLETVRDRAHAIKGIAITLLFNDIGDICNTLEYGIIEKHDIDLKTLSASLQQQLEQIMLNQEEIVNRFRAQSG